MNLSAREYQVSPQGDQAGDGSAARPFRTIGAAAELAQPGDVITVHAGTYREWVRPPRGGTSDAMRITYRAADGEQAVIKGSEVVTGWVKVQDGVWKAELPDSFFKGYNPYVDVLKGDWFHPLGRIHHTGEVFLAGVALREGLTLDEVSKSTAQPLWCCAYQKGTTVLWANFGDQDPNRVPVEVTTRQACFYPEKTGMNFITVRGFTMAQAATQWAPPTTEQPGLIGTHWSKGWIIEDNTVSDSKCSGITLGKDSASDVTGSGSADGYNRVVAKAAQQGWSKETVGSHLVRDNTIYNCGQTGICGSLGAIFSQVVHNHIYNIHRHESFDGFEIAGIKFHGAIDVLIAGNCIHDADRGLWLDWMAQGTHVTGNLFYKNGVDVFCEVDHGPYLLDNNLLMSPNSFLSHSEGGAFVHNLIAGKMAVSPDKRTTPFFKPHSAQIAGGQHLVSGDDRYFNNIIWSADMKKLYARSPSKNPVLAQGNCYGSSVHSLPEEAAPVILPAGAPVPELIDENGSVFLKISYDRALLDEKTARVDTGLLGSTVVSQEKFEQPDGTPLVLNKDYAGKIRAPENPTPGPFQTPGVGALKIKLWDAAAPQPGHSS